MLKVTKVEGGTPLPGSAETDPTIPEESGLNVGAITPVEVPEEAHGSYTPEGQDTDFSNQVRPEVRKPEAFEKFAVCVDQIMQTVLLVLRVGVKGYDVQYYYVTPQVRPWVGQGLKPVLVVPCWSFRDRRWFLWIVNANEESSYFANLKPFFEQGEEFYRGSSFTIETDKDGARYRIQKFAESRKFPGHPGRKTSLMLGQAIGQKGLIDSMNHPVIAEIAGGEDVNL